MLSINKEQITLTMNRNDLWQLVASLNKAVVVRAKYEWLNYFKGTDSFGFLQYVLTSEYCNMRVIEEIYLYLDRPELYEKFENSIKELFKEEVHVREGE